jgi:L-threonylcarbamoyladenylate synthase
MSVPLLSIADATAALRRGGIVAYPTETFYGLGAIPSNHEALEHLVSVKRRDQRKPISLILGRTESLSLVACALTPSILRLIALAWPGPLTVVLPARPDVDAIITGGTETVAARVPSHAEARVLADAVGGAITATSANRQGEAPPTTADEVRVQFAEGELGGIVSGQPTAGGSPSTLVHPRGRQLLIVRRGVIGPEKLREWWSGDVVEGPG